MRLSQHFRMSVTRRGEKELRLGAFIARGLHGLPTSADGSAVAPAERMLLVIARSAQSPVAKSIAALAREIAAMGCGVRTILARADRAGLPDAFIAAQSAALDLEVRLARNPRLIEAHEQLVICARTCWTGDSMRRDPAITDAYESFVEDCPAMAAAARSTFERLWTDAQPFTPLMPVPAATAGNTAKAIGLQPLGARRS
jgi:hypothetical protein